MQAVRNGQASRRVDVVVPTYNNRELVLRCVASLFDPAVASIIVVDDVSTDDTLVALELHAPEALVVALDVHRGLSHAANAGASRGEAPYILFLNDDVIAVEGSISRLVDQLDRQGDLVFAAGRLVDAETMKTQHQYKPHALPHTAALIARLVGVERYWPANPWTGHHLREPLREDAPTTISLQPAGACVLVRRDVFTEVGGWDDQFWFWYEDVDLAVRLLGKGQGVWDPAAVFRHVGAQSTRSWDKPTQHARLYNGTLRYARKHLPPAGRWLVAGVAFVACAARVPFYVIGRRTDGARTYVDLAKQALRAAAGGDPGEALRHPRRRKS